MSDKKLTDSEIVKDLNEAKDLENVLLYCKNPNKEVMIPIKITDIRDLINRLQARVEKCEKVEHFADKTISTLQAENERLKEKQEKCFYCTEQANKKISEIKAEAYKEFAERLKKSIKKSVDDAWHSDGNGIYDAECVLDDIDNLLKELVGEDNA